jgi:hypothetical protein
MQIYFARKGSGHLAEQQQLSLPPLLVTPANAAPTPSTGQVSV